MSLLDWDSLLCHLGPPSSRGLIRELAQAVSDILSRAGGQGQWIAYPPGRFSIKEQSRSCWEGILQLELKSLIIWLHANQRGDYPG